MSNAQPLAGSPVCGVMQGDGPGFTCSLEPNHVGPHEAHAAWRRHYPLLASWDDEELAEGIDEIHTTPVDRCLDCKRDTEPCPDVDALAKAIYGAQKTEYGGPQWRHLANQDLYRRMAEAAIAAIQR